MTLTQKVPPRYRRWLSGLLKEIAVLGVVPSNAPVSKFPWPTRDYRTVLVMWFKYGRKKLQGKIWYGKRKSRFILKPCKYRRETNSRYIIFERDNPRDPSDINYLADWMFGMWHARGD